MDIAQLDSAIRISGAALLLFLAATLLRDGRDSRQAALFLPLALCLSGFLLGNTPDMSLRPAGAAGAVAHVLAGFAAIFLWWFCLSCFDRAFRPRGIVLGAGIAWFCIAMADRGLFGSGLADRGLSWLLVAGGFAIVAHLGWRLIRDRAGDLVDRRRAARWLVVILLGGQLLIDLSVDLIFGLDWRPRGFAMAQNVAITGFTIWFAGVLLRADARALVFEERVGTSRAEAAAGLTVLETRLMERLRALIETERVFLEPDLDFAAFVRRTGAPERTVRRLIRRMSGQDNFRSFLNVHRVAEARRILADPRCAGEKLIAVAMDSGFASLASFNRVFRAMEGCTPSFYREAIGAKGSTRLAGAAPPFEEGSAAF
jgi:AraC-like DNA-binding protein